MFACRGESHLCYAASRSGPVLSRMTARAFLSIHQYARTPMERRSDSVMTGRCILVS